MTKTNVWEVDDKHNKFIGWSMIVCGIIFSLTIIGLIIGLPLIFAGIGFIKKQ